MRNAARPLLILTAAAALAACQAEEDPNQNITVDINSADPADIEALPADESSTTSSEELANGFDEPPPAESDNQANSL